MRPALFSGKEEAFFRDDRYFICIAVGEGRWCLASGEVWKQRKMGMLG